MQKHMTIINLACTITKLRKWGEAWKHSAESAQANTARLHQANKELEREKFMTAGLIDKLIADRDEAWKERDTQTAEHEAKMVEHRAAFGVRTEADAKIIAALRAEVELANGECNVLRALTVDTAKYKANSDLFYNEQKRRMDAEKERDGLRAEVAALQCIRPKFKVGDKLESDNRSLGLAMPVTVVGVRTVYDCKVDGAEYPVGHSEVELRERYAQTEPTPKQHSVKVGEWVRRIVPFPCFACLHCCRLCCLEKNPSPACGMGTVAKVVHVDDDTSEIKYDVKRIDGQHGVWFAKNCEPCDPPNHDTEAGKAAAEAVIRDDRNTEPKLGDTVRLVRVPTMEEYANWEDLFGVVGSLGIVKSLAHQVANVKYNDFTWEWPLSCVEVVTEATHDTEAGKAAAEAALKSESVTDIKVGDLCEVFQATTRTLKTDIGITGRVSSVHLDPCHGGFLVKFDPSTQSRRSTGMQAFGLCDVRKVTT